VTRYHDLLELLKGHVHRDGPYRLASGKLSPCYLDVRGALLTRRGAILAAAAVLAELRREGIPCRALGGPGLGGALLASSCLMAARADYGPTWSGSWCGRKGRATGCATGSRVTSAAGRAWWSTTWPRRAGAC
jgi:orotate phosphoribosyltransferase